MNAIDFYNLIAAKRGAPAGWRWVSLEVVDEQTRAFLLKGGVMKPYKSGKNVGKPNWKGRDKTNDRQYVVTRDELTAFEKEWERETGNCSKCYGDGKHSNGWNTSGPIIVDCKPCSATGKAVSP